MAKPVGIGLVGYGGIGRLHALCYRMLPLVYPQLPVAASLVAVAAATATTAERAQKELGAIVATTDLATLLEHPDVTVIDCCTPTGTHLNVAQATLEAGKTLFCEKPLAATADEARMIRDLARHRGLQAGVNYHFRWLPAVQEARRQIDAGLLGEVVSFHLSYYRASNLRRDRPLSWRATGSGSGVLLDLGSHLLDLVAHLLGPIATVAARTRTLITERPAKNGQMAPVESDDAVWLQLELAGGAFGTVEASKIVPGAADDIRIVAYGTQGSLIIDTRNPNSIWIAEGADAAVGGRNISTLSRTTPPASLPGSETPAGVIQWHLASIAAFLSSLDSEQPTTDLDDAVTIQQVLDAALHSAAHGGIVVNAS